MKNSGKNLLSGKNILIVDDEKSLRILLRRILESVGCIVEETESSREALIKLQNKTPDLIILDLMMPEHDGFVFMRAKSQLKIAQGLPILILSGQSTKETLKKIVSLGARHFIKKPLNTPLLIKKIKTIFYAEENYFYTFPSDDLPRVTGEVNAKVESISEKHIKISSPVKFSKSQVVVVKPKEYIKEFGGSPLTTRPDNRLIEVNEGLYEQILALTGQSQEDRALFDKWRRKLL